jgi:hypothetical protein
LALPNGIAPGAGLAPLRHALYIKEELMSLACATYAPADVNSFVLRLERLVQGRTGSRIRDLHVEVRDDEVVLTGRANSYYAKQLATHATLGEIAPRSLTNSIDVV